MSGEDDHADANRRTVLKSIGAGAAVPTGFLTRPSPEASGTPLPDEREQELLKQFGLKKATQEFGRLSRGIRDELAEQGYLESDSLDSLGINRLNQEFPMPTEAYVEPTLHVGAFWSDKGAEEVILIGTRTRVDGVDIEFSVNPVEDVAIGLVYGDDEVTSTVKRTSDGEITTSACSGWYCENTGDFCESCCGNAIDPDYQINHVCYEDGTYIYSCEDRAGSNSCCFNCGNDKKDGDGNCCGAG
jgi:hypothetical protein